MELKTFIVNYNNVHHGPLHLLHGQHPLLASIAHKAVINT